VIAANATVAPPAAQRRGDGSDSKPIDDTSKPKAAALPTANASAAIVEGRTP